MKAQLGFIHQADWKPANTVKIADDTYHKLSKRFNQQNDGFDVDEKICLMIDITNEADMLIEKQTKHIKKQSKHIKEQQETLEELLKDKMVWQGENKNLNQKMVVLCVFCVCEFILLVASIISNFLIH